MVFDPDRVTDGSGRFDEGQRTRRQPRLYPDQINEIPSHSGVCGAEVAVQTFALPASRTGPALLALLLKIIGTDVIEKLAKLLHLIVGLVEFDADLIEQLDRARQGDAGSHC